MDYRKRVFGLLIFTNLSIVAFAYKYSYCFDGNYTSNSTYSNNLHSLLSSLPSNMNDSGFYHASLGQDTDLVYATALCRGDLELVTCRSCVQIASAKLLKACQNIKQALEWADLCTVRYSNESFFGNWDSDSVYWLWDTGNVTSPDQFNADLTKLVLDLRIQAASGGSLMKLAAGNKAGPDRMTIYALLQCSPDLSEQDCSECLAACAEVVPSCCPNLRGVRLFTASCNLRYDVYPFYNLTRIQEAQGILSMPRPRAQGNGHRNNWTVSIIVISVVFGVVIVACLGICMTKKRKKTQPEASDDIEISTLESLRYDINKIRVATNNFADVNKLGEGGFGVVYKGKLEDGQEIAVKRLLRRSAEGDVEFRNEVILLAKLQHKNLVRLVGFAQEGTEKVLIYEFIKNASLDHFIFDPSKAPSIDWIKRFKIIRGIARGLLYLHEDSRLRIIHRDLKPSNILLDGNMNPKIADFGIARLCERDGSHQHNTRKVAGTWGYMAPEYVLHGRFSTKSDVFSFGVLVLEIICGQKNFHFQNGDTTVEEIFLNFVWRNWHEGTMTTVIDPILRPLSPSFVSEILRCVHIALLCVQENATDRPTMASIVLMLRSFTVTLPLPSPPSSYGSNASRRNSSLGNGVDACNLESLNQISVTDLHPR